MKPSEASATSEQAAATVQDPVALAHAIDAVIASGKFRLLDYVGTPDYDTGFVPDPGVHDVVAIADCEATDGDPAEAEPIEIGIVKIAVEQATGAVVAYMGFLSQLEDPGIPSSPGALATHGITQEDLEGKSFDIPAIEAFMVGVNYVVAHSASYDRQVIGRRTAALEAFPWVCSLRELDWKARGCSSRTLDFLLFKAGYAHDAHRAVADCEALAVIISHSYADQPAGLVDLRKMARGKSQNILAVNAEFDAKKAMQDRGYSWNPGDGLEGKFPVKCWSSPILNGSDATTAEILWLAKHAYLPQKAYSEVVVVSTDARMRHRADTAKLAAAAGFKVNLAQFVKEHPVDPESSVDKVDATAEVGPVGSVGSAQVDRPTQR